MRTRKTQKHKLFYSLPFYLITQVYSVLSINGLGGTMAESSGGFFAACHNMGLANQVFCSITSYTQPKPNPKLKNLSCRPKMQTCSASATVDAAVSHW